MSEHQVRSFSTPDDVIDAEGVRSEIVDLGGISVARNVHQPGWRWSTHVRPVVGTEWCQARHVGVVISGKLHVITEDGRQFDLDPGDAFHIQPGHDAWVVGDQPYETIDWIGARTWLSPLGSSAGVLATLLFTDIVDSTGLAQRMGDNAWGDLIAAHEEGVRDALARFGGREVKSTGDGVLAMFDGTARAIRCAAALHALAGDLGVQIRAAVHVGEVEPVEGDLRGLAVHEANRMMALAQPGEILVSATTRALTTDHDIRFEERGEHFHGRSVLIHHAGGPVPPFRAAPPGVAQLHRPAVETSHVAEIRDDTRELGAVELERRHPCVRKPVGDDGAQPLFAVAKLPGARLDLPFEVCVRLLQLRRHEVELVGKLLDFIAGPGGYGLAEMACCHLSRSACEVFQGAQYLPEADDHDARRYCHAQRQHDGNGQDSQPETDGRPAMACARSGETLGRKQSAPPWHGPRRAAARDTTFARKRSIHATPVWCGRYPHQATENHSGDNVA